MKEVLQTLLNSSHFIPHGHCYLWQSQLVALHLISDVLIAIAYYSIPITLLYFVHKRQDIPFNGIFLLFSAFIVACGTTHLMEVWTLWHPVYWLSGSLKLITAVVSLYTSFILVSLLPKALALPGLAATNQKLEAVIAEHQKTELALRESEERFRNTFDQAAVGIAHVALSGQFLRLNQRFCDIAGYDPLELQALTFQEITHSDDLELDLRRLHDLLNGKIQTYSLEKRYIRKDRSLVWIHLTVSLVRDPSGEPKYFIAVIEDIDDRKWIELALRQSEATLKLFVKHVPAGIAMLDTNLCYVFASQRWIEAYRLGSVEFIAGHSHYEIFPEIPERWRQIHQRCLAGAIERCEEDLFEREDGSQQWIRWEIRPWFTGNEIGGILIFSEDITEQKQAKSNLKESEERLSLALAAANQGIYDVNVQTGEVIVNPSYAIMLGYDPTTFRESAADWAERLHPEDRDAAFKRYQDYIAGKVQEYRSEFRLRTSSGDWMWTLSMGKITAWDEDGQPLRMLGTHTDISDRKQAEAALSQLASIVESSADAIISKTLDGTIVSWNAGAENLFGYTAAEAIGQPILLLIPPECRSEESDILERIRQGELVEHYETMRQHKDGRLIDISLTVSPIRDGTGQIIGASKIARDISPRKQVEAERLQAERLRLELQLLENILEVTFAGYWDWDIPGNQQYLSPTLKRMFGYEDHELLNVPETWQRLIFEEDWPGVMECFNQHVESRGQIPYYNEVRCHHKDGSTVWVICSGRVIEWNQTGHPLRMIGCHIDITERKRAETQLQESEAELRALFSAMTDAVIVRDREGRCLKIAPNSSSLYHEPTEMLGRTLHETIPQPEADLLLAKIHECLNQQTPMSVEYSLTIQGNPVYFLATISPLSANTVIIAAHNISNIKQIETNLKRYERIVSSTKDGIALLDHNYTYQVANQAYLTWCNKSHAEVVGHTVREVLGPDLFDRFIQPRLDQCLAGETIQYEKWFDYPNLVPQFLSVTYVPYLDVNQTIAGVIVSLRDITDLRQAEESLRISEERLQLALEGSGDGLWDWNLVTDEVYFSLLWQTMLGYAEGELPSNVTIWQQLIHPDDKTWVINQLNAHLKDSSASYSFDYRVLTKSGEWKWIANYGKVVARDEQGAPLRMVGTHKDISDRKQTEDALRESEKRFATLAAAAPVAIFRFDTAGQCLYVNDRWSEMTGEPKEVGLGLGWVKTIHPDDREWISSAVVQWSQTCKAGDMFRDEARILRPDGTIIWYFVQMLPETDAKGTITGYVGILADITDRKQIEANLRQSEEFKRRILESSSDCIKLLDLDGRLMYMNGGGMCLMEIDDLDPFLNQEWVSFWPNNTHEDAKTALEKARAGEVGKFQGYCPTAKGTPKWWDVVVTPIRSVTGQVEKFLSVSRDITDRKQAEQTLQELSTAMQNAVEGISRLDTNGRYITINPAYANTCGYEPEELIGQPWQQTVYPDDLPKLIEAYQQMLDSGRVEVEARGIRKDGSTFYKQVTMITAHDEKGNIIGHHCFMKDISDRKQAEFALETYTREVEDLYDNAPCGYHSLDAEGRFVKVNETELRWLGYTREEMLGKPFTAFVSEAGRIIFKQNYPQFKERGWVKDLEFDLICKDGTPFRVLLDSTSVKGADGNYLHSRSTLFDIRDRKKAEEALAKYAREVEDLYNNAPCGYHSLDAEGRFVNINETELQWLGYAREEILGRPFTDFISQADRLAFEQNYLKFKQQGWIKDLEYEMVCKDGTQFPVLLNATAVKSADGKYLYNRATLYDNRNRKQAEEQLRLSSERLSFANAELARASRLKDEFLAGMSHELRTPLNAVLGLSEALLEEVYGDLTPEQRDSLQLIEKSGQHLLSLINDILDLSKIESGKMELELNTVSVKVLCESSLNFVKQQANHKQIRISCQIAEELTNIEADERRLRQVLVNLLSNAVKFTPDKGCVELRVSADPLREIVKFSITDTGIGIAPENMDRLFQPFVQLDSSLSRRYEGTGLGLALVRRIMDLHGGSISLESEVGKGSCFTFILPWVPLTHLTASAPYCNLGKQVHLDIERALIVEDSKTAANQMIRYLTNFGAQAIVHPQGEGALEAAIQNRPNVIILDILLPGKTGWDVLTDLKATPATKDIPVIVISVVDERSRALELGAAEYLLKPITYQQLQFTLNQVLSTLQPTAQTALVLTSSNSLPPPLVLLAEDNEANITTITLYLEAQGLQTVVARNGLEAIQIAQQHQPALILMDIQMPEVDGLEAIHRIRSNTELSQIPIIALTALAMPGDRERCLSAGANEYMTKPVRLKQLFTLISTYVTTQQTRK